MVSLMNYFGKQMLHFNHGVRLFTDMVNVLFDAFIAFV